MTHPPYEGREVPTRHMLEKSAITRLDLHERVCNERWRNLEETLARLEHTIRRIETRMWQASYAIAAAACSGFIVLIWDRLMNS